MRRASPRWAVVSALAVAGLAAVARAQDPGAPPVVPPPGAPAAGASPPAAPMPLPATVKITITSAPVQKHVAVFWGKRRLGVLAPHQPLTLQRPRDSGPLDLIVQCEGFVPVQTRAYTFGDTKLVVKLTPLDQKNTLLGYREEVPAPPPAVAADGGVPLPPPAAALPAGVAAPPAGVAAPPPGAAAPPPARATPPAPKPDSGAR